MMTKVLASSEISLYGCDDEKVAKACYGSYCYDYCKEDPFVCATDKDGNDVTTVLEVSVDPDGSGNDRES